MAKFLIGISVFFILAGTLGFVFLIGGISEVKYDMDYWAKSAKVDKTNSLIQAEADKTKQTYTNQLTISISSLVSGVVVGAFFLALSKIISLLSEIRNNQNRKHKIIYTENSISV